MLTLLTILPVLLLIGWIIAEFRCRTRTRLALGLAMLIATAIMAFLWGGFTEAFSHAEFLEPHDSPGQTAAMDAAEKSGTNDISK